MSIHRKSLFGILILLVVVGIVVAQTFDTYPPLGGMGGQPRDPRENRDMGSGREKRRRGGMPPPGFLSNSIIEGTIRLHLENRETKEIDMLLIETQARKLGNTVNSSSGISSGYSPKEQGIVYEKWIIVRFPVKHPYLQFSDGKKIRVEGVHKTGVEWHLVKGQKITRDLYVLDENNSMGNREPSYITNSRSSLELQVQQLQEEVSILNEEVYYLKKDMDMIRRKLATFR